MNLCIQCVLRALVAGETPTLTPEETPEAHCRIAHPDPQATYRERVQLEATLIARYGGTARFDAAMADFFVRLVTPEPERSPGALWRCGCGKVNISAAMVCTHCGEMRL